MMGSWDNGKLDDMSKTQVMTKLGAKADHAINDYNFVRNIYYGYYGSVGETSRHMRLVELANKQGKGKTEEQVKNAKKVIEAMYGGKATKMFTNDLKFLKTIVRRKTIAGIFWEEF